MKLKIVKEKLNDALTLPMQIVIYVGAIILIETGTRVHKLWKRRKDHRG
jgi:hydroxymethylglutaryl-CoA reductase